MSTTQALNLFHSYLSIAVDKGIWTQEGGSSFKDHCYLTAAAAEIIASKAGLDSRQAYILGLLHDFGKVLHKEDGGHFHGLLGFEYMNNINEPLVAKVCITHTFLDKDFNFSDYAGYGLENLKKSKQLLEKIEEDDYSRLIRLSDLLVNVYRHGTLKERMVFIKNKYKVDITCLRTKYKKAMYLKNYFDVKCFCDIYDLLCIR